MNDYVKLFTQFFAIADELQKSMLEHLVCKLCFDGYPGAVVEAGLLEILVHLLADQPRPGRRV